MFASTALLTVALVSGAGAPLTPPPLVDAEVPLPAHERSAHLGVSVDVGVPDGAGAALTFGPWRWLRLQVGPSHNGASLGVRGGVTVSPLSGFFRPTLSVIAGYFPEGDAQKVVRFVTGDDQFRAPVLSRVQYEFGSAQLGFDVGAPRGAAFFLRAGVSRTVARLYAFEAAARDATGDASLTARTPVIRLTSPSVHLGVHVPIY